MHGRNCANVTANVGYVNCGCCGKGHQNAKSCDGDVWRRRGGCRRDSSDENALLSEKNWLEQRLNAVKERLDAIKTNINIKKAEENNA
jgi:hypothetical protein